MNNFLLCLDPGPTESAVLVYDPKAHSVRKFFMGENRAVKATVYQIADWAMEATEEGELLIEKMVHYGKSFPIGDSVIEAQRWAARCEEVWWTYRGKDAVWMPRVNVRVHLTGTARSDDAGVRAALIDRWGGNLRAAQGTKKAKGPLYGIKSHLWSALALGVAYDELQRPRAVLDRTA